MRIKLKKNTEYQRGGSFFWPKMFLGQKAMDTKKKQKMGFFGVFLQFGKPIFQNFKIFNVKVSMFHKF